MVFEAEGRELLEIGYKGLENATVWVWDGEEGRVKGGVNLGDMESLLRLCWR